MQRKRAELVPIGEALGESGRAGEGALRHGPGEAPHFTRVDQVNGQVWPRGPIATL